MGPLLESNQVTINGELLVPATKQDDYVYDYYFLETLIESGDDDDNGRMGGDDEDEVSSNDENYRYNDYPDEDDDFARYRADDEESDDSRSSRSEPEIGEREFDTCWTSDDEKEYADPDNAALVDMLKKHLKLGTSKNGKDEFDSDDDDSDDDYSTEFVR